MGDRRSEKMLGDLEISGSALRPDVSPLHVKTSGIHDYGAEGLPLQVLNQKQLILHRLQNITRYIVFIGFWRPAKGSGHEATRCEF